MKFIKADPKILIEGLENPRVHGRKGDLFCSYIGAVEIVVGEDADGYVSDLYLAVQLPTGEILYVDANNNAFSLSNKLFKIHWGYYPVGFDPDLKTKRNCPNTLNKYKLVECAGEYTYTSVDELPF